MTLRLPVSLWGKHKLAVFAEPPASAGFYFQGGPHSHSTEAAGPLVGTSPLRRSRIAARPAAPAYAVRKPRQYAVSRSGDLVEVDTLDVRPVPGVICKPFTARDVISRWDVIQTHTRATAQTAAQFLDTLQHRMPFPLRAVQVDGGSEFAKFELARQQRRLHLSVLPA